MDTKNNIKLGIVITFCYRENRLEYLNQVLHNLSNIIYDKEITIITDKKDTPYTYVGELEHPFHLPWYHISYMKKYYEQKDISHFLYLEDDIAIRQNNIDYWLYHRHNITNKQFFPGFIRAEKLYDSWYAVDIMNVHTKHSIKRYNEQYINLFNNHQAMYMMDRDMMTEYLSCPASQPYHGTKHHHGIIEASAEGLLYYNIPQGFYSRNLIHFEYNMPDINSIIHHCSNNYVANQTLPVAKLLLKECIHV